MKTSVCLLVALLLALASPGFAIAPESGMYWQPNYSGRAFYIEHQNGRVGVAVYAFDRETGAAEIYVSGGQMHHDDFVPDQHVYESDLFKATDGPPLANPAITDQPATAVKVGRVKLEFRFVERVYYEIELDDGGTDEGALERFAFGYARYHLLNYGGRVAVDLRGDWVFVDINDQSQDPLRFRFSERVPSDLPLSFDINQFFRITYLDPQRDARLVCAIFFGNTGSPPAPIKRPGCEMYLGEELQFSANYEDMGVDRIQAYRGELPLYYEDSQRGEGTIIGLRVVMPPEPTEALGQK